MATIANDHQVRNQNSPKNQWDIAPADHEIYSMDHIRPMYRQAVEQYVNVPNKSLMKKPFFTIATNVLGPDIDCTVKRNPSIDDSLRDIYLPLEIAITKWSIRDSKLGRNQRELDTRVWVINPGKVHYSIAHYSRLHTPKHKIQFQDEDEESPYVEYDIQKIVKEINSFLTVDRVVFSQTLRHVRQDLGSLKWLHRESQSQKSQLKPISVLNMSDLYVLLIRKFNHDPDTMIGEGIARYRLNGGSSFNVCQFHKALEKAGQETPNCAKGLTIGKTHRLLDDVRLFGELFGDDETRSPKTDKRDLPSTSTDV